MILSGFFHVSFPFSSGSIYLWLFLTNLSPKIQGCREQFLHSPKCNSGQSGMILHESDKGWLVHHGLVWYKLSIQCLSMKKGTTGKKLDSRKLATVQLCATCKSFGIEGAMSLSQWFEITSVMDCLCGLVGWCMSFQAYWTTGLNPILGI